MITIMINRKENYLIDFWRRNWLQRLIEAVTLQKSVSFILKFLFVSLFWFIYFFVLSFCAKKYYF